MSNASPTSPERIPSPPNDPPSLLSQSLGQPSRTPPTHTPIAASPYIPSPSPPPQPPTSRAPSPRDSPEIPPNRPSCPRVRITSPTPTQNTTRTTETANHPSQNPPSNPIRIQRSIRTRAPRHPPPQHQPLRSYLPSWWRFLPARVHHRDDTVIHYCALGTNGWETMQQERVRLGEMDIGKIDESWAANGGGVILNFKEMRKGKERAEQEEGIKGGLGGEDEDEDEEEEGGVDASEGY